MNNLQNTIIKGKTDFTGLNEKQCLESIKRLAVIPVAIGVRRSELLAMNQDAGEPSREFHARVKGKADVCAYKTKVKCDWIIVVLLVLFGNPDFYDSGRSGSLAIIVLVPRPENDEIELLTGRADETVCLFLTSFRIIVVLLLSVIHI